MLRRRTRVYPLSSIASVRVRVQAWSDGAPGFSLALEMADGATFHSGSSWSRDGVEQARARVERILDRAHGGRPVPGQ